MEELELESQITFCPGRHLDLNICKHIITSESFLEIHYAKIVTTITVNVFLVQCYRHDLQCAHLHRNDKG